jgi:predicted transcriptional regulator
MEAGTMKLNDNEKAVARVLMNSYGKAFMSELNEKTNLNDFDVIKAVRSLKDKGFSIRGYRTDYGRHAYGRIEMSIPIKKDEHAGLMELIEC